MDSVYSVTLQCCSGSQNMAFLILMVEKSSGSLVLMILVIMIDHRHFLPLVCLVSYHLNRSEG